MERKPDKEPTLLETKLGHRPRLLTEKELMVMVDHVKQAMRHYKGPTRRPFYSARSFRHTF